MTTLLYYDDPTARRCTARVDAVVPGVDSAGGAGATYRITLDQTCFYPAGGGQPGDRGILRAGDVDYRVVDTFKGDDGTPVHTVAGAVAAGEQPALVRAPVLQPGAEVELELDWDHRFDYMQQHTGQHLLSAALYRVAGANTVSVHQGERHTTIEVDRPDLPEEVIAEVEAAARAIILESRPVRSFVVDSGSLSGYSLRRPTDRTGRVRLVEIDDFDRVACAGVHLPTTGQVGNVLTVGQESIRGHARLAFMIGNRAHLDYRQTHHAARLAAELFSAAIDNLPDRVEQALTEIKALHGTNKALSRRVARLTVDAKMAPGTPAGTTSPLVLQFRDEEDALFEAVVREVAERGGSAACVVNTAGQKTRWAIVVQADKATEMSKTVRGIIDSVHAKGGGRPPVWQGVCPNAESLVAAFRSAFTD